MNMDRSKEKSSRLLEFETTVGVAPGNWLRDAMPFQGGDFRPGEREFEIKFDEKRRIEHEWKGEKFTIEASTSAVPCIVRLHEGYFEKTNSDDALAIGLHRFVTHLIDCIEHIYLAIGKVQFKLDGRVIFYKKADKDDWRILDYQKRVINLEEIFQEYSLLGDTGHYDVVCMEAGREDAFETSWQFVIDAVDAFDSGHYRGSVVYACSAVETEVGQIVRKWFEANTLTSPEDLLDTAMRDLSNPMRFEVFFKLEKDSSLAVLSDDQRISLLNQLKWLNAVRNKVIHSGHIVNALEAQRAIRAAGILLRLRWVDYRRKFFKEKGLGDVFDDFPKLISRLKI